MQPHTMYGHATLIRAFDYHAHITERLDGGQRVFALEKAFDLCGSLGQRAEHDRTVGNGFVAWHTQLASQAAAGVGEEDQVIGMHNVHIGSASQYFAEMFPGSSG